ncbi:hypothetical protein CLV92_107235 [Kineococcus xinjiangensis]|uniref:DNA-binding phage zinc finger domain-containing protein n=1 Tax=Kineococcus xinjiangensis TaxID=512762 RepID=A0A2S6IKH5_9ACTN|nr:hypothetical protein [Kineococcus xinjiangensis]PPK94732.1 hypothetical protein CLV92_107235 [Kineococcus xinjiangensis]
MTVTAISPQDARAAAAPALREECPTCAADIGERCRHVSTGVPLSGGVHPMRIGARARG